MKLIQNILDEWEILELNNDNYTIMKEQFLIDKPAIIGTDTETDGLNLLQSKPFDIIFGWMTRTSKKVFVWLTSEAPKAIDDYKEIIDSHSYKLHFCWNAVFDASMLLNIGVDIRYNLADGQSLLRLSSYADDRYESKALKKVSVKYLAPDANVFEIELKNYLSNLKKDWQKSIKTWHYSGWSYNSYNSTLKNEEYIPDEVTENYNAFMKEHPEPNYTNIPKNILHRYSPADVVLMLELVKLFYPRVVQTGQLPIFEKENQIIPAIMEQTRVGIPLDLAYLAQCKKLIKEKIEIKRQSLYKVLGDKINASQNKEIALWLERQGVKYPDKQVLNKRTNEIISSKDYKADGKFLKILSKKLSKVESTSEDAESRKQAILQVCELVPALRTLEKWYSTYILRLEDNAAQYGDGRFHGRYDAFGAVSGRFTSDFQQFPRQGVYDANVEIFNPRRAFITDPDCLLVYLDYSQIELRLAGTMTIKAGLPDETILNAYMNWNEVENWKPTDMHLAMAKEAFDLSDEDVKIYEKYDAGEDLSITELKRAKYVKEHRSLAKIANFSSLYNGGWNAINEGLFEGQNEEQSKKVSAAFKRVFKGVINYQRWCADEILSKGYVKNLLGRIYQFSDRQYKAQADASNYIIQGTGADFLKSRMAAVYNFIKSNNLETKLVGSIHDEMQFMIPKNEQWIIPKLKEIMESECPFSEVPVIADVEYTTTNWADKKNWHGEVIE